MRLSHRTTFLSSSWASSSCGLVVQAFSLADITQACVAAGREGCFLAQCWEDTFAALFLTLALAEDQIAQAIPAEDMDFIQVLAGKVGGELSLLIPMPVTLLGALVMA
eukprot:1194970-Prorocentrum_lima.AAC.1